MSKIIWIAGGGALGAVLRYLVAGWAQNLTRGTFPLGTLTVNLCGCFVLGMLAALTTGSLLLRPELRLALLIGLLGGFTTFSTFAFETFQLLASGSWFAAASNLLLSNLLGLGGVWAGWRLGSLF